MVALYCLLCAERREVALPIAPLPTLRPVPRRVAKKRGRKIVTAPDGFLTVADLAVALGTTTQTVARWCTEGRFVGSYQDERRVWLVPRSAIAEAVLP